jgi:rhodanese-related sulfurtransferase
MKTMTVDEVQDRLDQGERFQMIDVRSPGEYAAGHIPCAVNLPIDEVEGRLDDLHHRDPVLLVCQSGRRARLTRELLQPHLNELIVLEGGTGAWTRAGLPLVRSTLTRWSLERQVRLIAGLLTVSGAGLALFVHPLWAVLPLGVGAGLAFAGLTNMCGLAFLLTGMPWNRPKMAAGRARPASCCD